MGIGVIARTIVFGADCFDDLKDVARGFRKVKDDNIIRGKITLFPMLKPFAWIPYINKVTQKYKEKREV